jgi:SAM-dependent methyltransferase
MLDFARKRLRRFGDQCRFVTADLAGSVALKVPESPFRFIITVDAIHEIPDAAKTRLFKFCRRNLASDGLLLILDRIALDLPRFRRPLASVLGRLQRVSSSRSGQFSDCFADPRHQDDEHPLALEPYFRLLRRTGFSPALLHLHFHKALIAARPEPPA